MNPSLRDWASARRALARQVAANGVGIDRGRGARFSGIVWDGQTLVTAAEVLQGADSASIHTAHGTVVAEILACDLSVDVAVLKAETGVAGISAAAPDAACAGDEVLIAGRAESGTAILWSTLEQVGPAWRSRSGGELERLIRLSAPVPSLLEGGGIFDLDGHLCAMAVRGPRHTGLGIPAETIGRVVATVLEHGRLPQPYLGVRLRPVRLDAALRQQLGLKGAEATLIVGVEPDSPAAPRLLFGDLILSVAGQPIETAIDLKVALARTPLGSSVGIQVYRAGARLDTEVVVRERG